MMTDAMQLWESIRRHSRMQQVLKCGIRAILEQHREQV